ncbi:hypothetical protein A3Q56_03671 [Intoshia linei]|uniref:Uncharacterized protein n=1 Tax=Intoshia linei TaxID=1819745 RepID=A0A177B2I5_9BILA|nr:hypothetical protein A3Q56_03671 [Intoshia linei]
MINIDFCYIHFIMRYLFHNKSDCYVCMRCVYVLITRVSSLSLNILLTLRKLISIIISIFIFNHVVTWPFVVGLVLIFIGMLIYTDVHRLINEKIMSKSSKKIFSFLIESIKEKRGVKSGNIRGRYAKPEDETKRRILKAYENEDWKVVAARRGIKCIVKRPLSQGTITSTSLAVFLRQVWFNGKEGVSHQKNDCHEWLRKLLNSLNQY